MHTKSSQTAISTNFFLISLYFFRLENYRQKNGADVKSVASLQGRYQIHNKEHNFIVSDTTPEDAGIYTCNSGTASAEIKVIGELNED